MFLAGYTFHVLDNIFLNHRGFKESSQMTIGRAKQLKNNREIFLYKHLRELTVKCVLKLQ
jgi:hypothetical protein